MGTPASSNWIRRRHAAGLLRFLLFLLLIVQAPLLAWQESDSTRAPAQPDSLQTSGLLDTLMIRAPDSTWTAGPLFHNPPVAILNDRPFRMDLIVSSNPDNISSISLFIKGDTASVFKEIPLTMQYGRCQYNVPVEELQGAALTYYFLLTTKDYRLWAYPLDEHGTLQPFVIELVPPTREFFQMRYYE